MEEKEIFEQIREIGRKALLSSREALNLSSRQKDEILLAMAASLEDNKERILSVNAIDYAEGKRAGLTEALLDRLLLTETRFSAMVKGLIDVSKLKDPVGDLLSQVVRPNGLCINKIRVPIGVIAIIYESRPNVTVDAASLCIKTSNAVILRGGKEVLRSNSEIVSAMIQVGLKAGMPTNLVQFISLSDRKAVQELVRMEGLVDLVIPRGGESLIRAVSEMARVPVLKHYKGVCHVYVDLSADLDMALRICENAKCQRPGVCNAMETLLVHKGIASTFLPKVGGLLRDKNVEIRGDDITCGIIPYARAAQESDWDEEYLDLILSIKVVEDINQAIDHINEHGSRHSDAIITSDESAQNLFVHKVDSGVLMINASTRFNDGGEFGMGAEMGISTDKFHARGPVGLEELCTYKYIVRGNGQIRG